MVFVVCVNGTQTPFNNLHDANTFVLDTGLGFPDAVVIDTEVENVKECVRFLK